MLNFSTPKPAALTSDGPFSNLSAKKDNRQHFWHLSPQDIIAFKAGVKHFQSLKLPLNKIDRKTFTVSDSLSSRLKDVARLISGQQKFLIITGLDPQEYTDEEHLILHAGIASHISSKRGTPGREGGDNTVVRKPPNSAIDIGRSLIEDRDHIVAMIASPRGSTGQYHAPPNQTRDIPFHTDNGDIVSLFTLSTSQNGGAFYLADTTAVYEDLKAIKPKLAHALLENWTIVNPSPKKPHDVRPIAFVQQESGRVLMNCSRARITGTPCAPRPKSLPALSRTQKEALDALHMLAKRRAVKIQLQPGDMIFFDNLSMLHARDAFIDNTAEGHKRHLLRLILKNDVSAYKLPAQLAETWKDLYDHDVEEEILPIKKELFSYATSH